MGRKFDFITKRPDLEHHIEEGETVITAGLMPEEHTLIGADAKEELIRGQARKYIGCQACKDRTDCNVVDNNVGYGVNYVTDDAWFWATPTSLRKGCIATKIRGAIGRLTKGNAFVLK